jgi:hypothetical protein
VEIVPQEKVFGTEFGSLKVSEGIFTGTAQVANSLVTDRGDIAWAEFTCPHQPSQLARIEADGSNAVTRLVGD